MALDVVRRGPERMRVGPWRGDPSVGYLGPVPDVPPATATMVDHCCAVLAARGFTTVVTGALAQREQSGFLAAGFEVREELHLLGHDLTRLPPVPRVGLRRGRRRDRRGALVVDRDAFDAFWRLDEAGLAEALSATPVARFRVVSDHGRIVGYAVSGRAGARGYLQRLAVDPGAQGRGLGRALVLDALHWMRRRGGDRAVVNTQVSNERALALYQALGFRLAPTGLAVLGRRLEARQPAP